MRVAVIVALIMLSACATEKLALAPPAGVDLSGHWQLNAEESDDPLHLIQSQTPDPSKATPGSQGPGGQGGRGGRSGRGSAYPAGSMPGPRTPSIGTLNEGLRWPGNLVEIKQVAGVVAITSAGLNQVYQPTSGEAKPRRHKPSDADAATGRDRDMPALGRGPPPVCGWDDKTLVIQSAEGDEDHPPFEERYSISEDGRRLIETIGFKGRSGGFTMSRVWDRVVEAAP